MGMFPPAIPLSPNPEPGRLAAASRGHQRNATTGTNAVANGSDIILALEDAYNKIRNVHPDLIKVIFITGTGVGPHGARWGHFSRQRWLDAISQGRHPEMFIAGETLAFGAEHTLRVILHESAHGLAAVRDIEETSAYGRYHNKKFLALAEELGLEFRNEHSKSVGYSDVYLTDESRLKYKDALQALQHASDLQLDTLAHMGLTLSPDGQVEGGCAPRRIDRSPRKAKDKNLLKCVCECDPPRVIRASKKVLMGAPIQCVACMGDFHEEY